MAAETEAVDRVLARVVDQLVVLAGMVDLLDRHVTQLAEDVDRLDQLEKGRPE
jgi:hypothetical protein